MKLWRVLYMAILLWSLFMLVYSHIYLEEVEEDSFSISMWCLGCDRDRNCIYSKQTSEVSNYLIAMIEGGYFNNCFSFSYTKLQLCTWRTITPVAMACVVSAFSPTVQMCTSAWSWLSHESSHLGSFGDGRCEYLWWYIGSVELARRMTVPKQ